MHVFALPERDVFVMDAILASWYSWQPELRRSALQLDDVETLRCIDAQVRILWCAEMRVRQLASNSTAAPLAEKLSQYKLLTSMRFDGNNLFVTASLSAALGGKQHQVIEWDLHEDPSSLQNVLRRVLVNNRSSVAPSVKEMKKASWPKLLQPSAKSWAEFELQLSRILLQMLICAGCSAELPVGLVTAPSVDQSMSMQDAPIELGEWADEPAVLSTSRLTAKQLKRQEKRVLQRLRRSQCREAKRAARGCEAALPSGAEMRNESSSQVDPDGTDHHDHGVEKCSEDQLPPLKCIANQESNGTDCDADDKVICNDQVGKSCIVSNEPVVETVSLQQKNQDSLISGAADSDSGDDLFGAIALQQQAQQLAVELQQREHTRNSRSAAAAALKSVGASAFPTVLSLALEAMGRENQGVDDSISPAQSRAVSGERQVHQNKVEGRQVAVAEDATKFRSNLEAAPSIKSGDSGIGQGRPLSSRTMGIGIDSSTPSFPLGVGRGRFLAPPPGLASRRIEPQMPQPDGLSQNYQDASLLRDYSIIPEETIGDMDSVASSDPSDVGFGAKVHQDMAASPCPSDSVFEAKTPEQTDPFMLPPAHFPETDATCSLGAEIPRPPSPLFSNKDFSRAVTPQVSWSKTPSEPGTPKPEFCLDPVARRVQIPTYVTVPLAAAHSCPNCGIMFALPPGGFGDPFGGLNLQRAF